MKDSLLTILRDKNTTMSQFRQASTQLGLILAHEASQLIEYKRKKIDTQLGPFEGHEIKNDIVLVPILRSGLALLFPFMQLFPKAKVGFVGLERDEETAVARSYYCKFPEMTKNDDVIVLDPMIATGGSATDTLKFLRDEGIKEEKIVFVGVIAATEGVERIKKEFPKVRVIVPQVDKELNNKKFIVPGLGDFGDRYFGTE